MTWAPAPAPTTSKMLQRFRLRLQLRAKYVDSDSGRHVARFQLEGATEHFQLCVGTGVQRCRFLKLIGGPNVKCMVSNSILTMQRHRPNVKIWNYWGTPKVYKSSKLTPMVSYFKPIYIHEFPMDSMWHDRRLVEMFFFVPLNRQWKFSRKYQWRHQHGLPYLCFAELPY